ncbi:GAF domain-containing protein [Paraburkholderia sp. J76]|uniref:GAF domain-containing protein n=1 Tax=Paraburkholderia sp. J76 TaxID=2805439 RepID=UPI002ABDCBAE|nr:GAF domain-containing protein [Paraburkholderia sp. J76]
MVGKTLLSLLDKSDETSPQNCATVSGRLKERFDECISQRAPVTLEVSVAEYTHCERESARLLLIPDLAPSGRVLGVLAVIELKLEDRVREQIGRIARNASICTWQERLKAILDEVGRLIDFDHVNFGLYADDMQFFRAFALYPRDHLRWSDRWLPIAPEVKTWLEAGRTSIADIREFSTRYRRGAKSAVGRMYEDRGMRACATLIARNEKGPTSALSFCSKTVGAYSQSDVELLRNLDLEPVLIRIEEQIKNQRRELGLELKHMVATAKSLPEVAKEVVDRLVPAFHWDSVSLYRLDRQKELFTLLYQNSQKKAFEIPESYTQPFAHGMLGACLREEKQLMCNQLGEPGVEQYDYINLGRKGIHSAITIPLWLNGRIRWMLNIETHEAHAFHGLDLQSIEELSSLLQEGLNQRATEEISKIVMLETRQGVVVVGMDGAIFDLNKAARRLLGIQKDRPEYPFLKDYAAKDDACASDVLQGLGSTEKRHIKLLGEDGRVRPVFATRRVLDGSFDTAIWFLIDTKGRTWEVDMRFLRETVADVAQQTRAPLALASNLARALPKFLGSALPGNSEVQTLVTGGETLSRRLLAEIGKADITFERLAEGVDIRRYPVRSKEPLDLLSCVTRVIDSLPQRDQKVIGRPKKKSSVWVNGDAERLRFVIRSLLAWLIRVSPDDGKVVVALTLGAGKSTVDLNLSLASTTPMGESDNHEQVQDVVGKAVRVAHADASLALDAIQVIVEKHGGKLETHKTADADDEPVPKWNGFHIVLPVREGGHP